MGAVPASDEPGGFLARERPLLVLVVLRLDRPELTGSRFRDEVEPSHVAVEEVQLV